MHLYLPILLSLFASSSLAAPTPSAIYKREDYSPRILYPTKNAAFLRGDSLNVKWNQTLPAGIVHVPQTAQIRLGYLDSTGENLCRSRFLPLTLSLSFAFQLSFSFGVHD